RRRSALAKRSIGGAQPAQRCRMNQPEWATIPIERHCRRNADEHVQAVDSRLQIFRGRHERVDVSIDLLLPAAREQAEHRLVWREAEGFSRFLTRRHVQRSIEERMADEGRIDSMASQERLFEW